MGTIICVGGAMFVTLYLRARPPQQLALQNSWRAIAVIMLVLMMNAVAATVNGNSSGDEGVPIGDKLPPNCHRVDSCGDCLCQEIAGESFCCDA